jgi:hypothetical protein
MQRTGRRKRTVGRKPKILILTATLLLVIVAPAMAKEGFYLGVNMLLSDVSGEVNSPEWLDSGSGLGLHGGFGLNRYFSIEAAVGRTKHDRILGGKTVDLKEGTLDLKINFPLRGSHIEPYLLIGYGIFTFDVAAASENGNGVRIGIGMDVYLFPAISFNVGLTRSNPTFKGNNVDVDGKIQTLDFGITYHFI